MLPKFGILLFLCFFPEFSISLSGSYWLRFDPTDNRPRASYHNFFFSLFQIHPTLIKIQKFIIRWILILNRKWQRILANQQLPNLRPIIFWKIVLLPPANIMEYLRPSLSNNLKKWVIMTSSTVYNNGDLFRSRFLNFNFKFDSSF